MILVTGAAGFIGSSLVARLLDEGYKLRAVDNFSVGKARKIGKFRIEERDILESPEELMKDVDVLIHLAAITGIPQCEENPRKANKNNLTALKQLLEKGESLKKVIFASSCAVYGDMSGKITEETPPEPLSYYGILKRASELLITGWAREKERTYVIFRQTNLYGRSHSPKGSLINAMCRKALKREPLTMHGEGHQYRDFLYLDDALNYYLEALKKDLEGIFHLGSGRSYPIKKVFEIIKERAEEHLEEAPDIIKVPKPEPGEDILTQEFNYDLSKLGKHFDSQSGVSLEKGVKKLIRDGEIL